MRNLILLLTLLFTSVTYGALSEVDRQEIGYTNYIKNGGCESGSAGVTMYADTGSRPVDGTGGSASISQSASLVSPLTGKGSCIFTKAAVNRQGEGWAIPFTVEQSAKASVLNIEFTYQVNSGTFTAGSSSSDSDVIVYIYDVTNGVAIEPTSFKLFSNSSTLPSKFIGNFQTSSNATSYRLIFHIATTSASAYSLKIDDISVGKSKITYGSIITDWQAYTPTITHASGGITNYTQSAYYRRVGSMLEIEGKITFTGTPAAFNQLRLGYPSGLVRDTSIASSLNLGVAAVTDFGVTQYDGVVEADSTFGYLTIKPANGTYVGYASITNTIPITFGTNDVISYRFSVPIQGWDSNVVLSSSNSNKQIVFVGYKTSTQAATADVTDLAYTAQRDSASVWNGTQFVVPESGDYALSLGGSSSAATTMKVFINGSLYKQLVDFNNTSNTSGSVIIYGALAGQNISVRSGSSVNINGGVTNSTATLSIYKLANPQVIGQVESIDASYALTSGTIGTSATLINFAIKEYDSHNAYSAGTFTAPVSGKYKISSFVTVDSANLSTSQGVILYAYKNGANYRTIAGVAGVGVARNHRLNGNTTVRLLAGETLSVYGLATISVNLTAIASENHVTIERVGNY